MMIGSRNIMQTFPGNAISAMQASGQCARLRSALFAPATTATRPSCDRMSVALQVFMCKLRMSLRSGRQVTGFSAFDVKLARHSVTRCLPFDMIFDFRGLRYCPIEGGMVLTLTISTRSGKRKFAFSLYQPAVSFPTERCEPLRSPQSVLESACRFPRIETYCASRCLAALHELTPHL